MSRRRKRRRRAVAIGAVAVAGAGGAGAAFYLRRRDPNGDDRIEAPSAVPAAVEPSLRGRSDDPALRTAPVQPPTAAPPSPEESLAVPEHDLPEGTVAPDTSAGDPLVDEETAAAAAQAGAIGGEVDEPVVEGGEAMRPVVEGSGDEFDETADETFDTGEARGEREKPA